MKKYKKEFIKFLLKNKALKFGDFTLKSGRKSPYFLNTGMLYSGEAAAKLGNFYAEAIKDNVKDQFNVVFGPAYKGIPLAVSAVISLYNNFDLSIDYTFNRKEAKDHGEAGVLVGKKLNGGDKIVLVDDVITAGTAVRESLELLKSFDNPKIISVIVSVDRMEKGQGEKSAINELEEKTGIIFHPVVNIKEIISFLQNNDYDSKEEIIAGNYIEKMNTYLAKHGI